MINVYSKNLRKSWLVNIVGPITVAGFVLMIASAWTSMQDMILDRLEAMSNPIYQAILGDLGLEGMGLTWQAAIFMYAGGVMNIVLLVVAMLIPARVLSTEIDKNTLDVVLSYPIPRWRYLLEKFSVYLTYNILFPILMVVVLIGSTVALGEEIDYILVVSYAIGTWFTLFALGAISLLCATIFLDSSKSLAAAGIITLGQYFLESMGGLIPVLSDLQFLSIFHYFKLDAIADAGMLPLNELFIVVTIGVLALSSALYIFQKREFAI
ncbi:MAG: ABC transporter permease [Candidatus Hodarchaeales archaeon]|jgi:ABC-2 type transport system permease protein